MSTGGRIEPTEKRAGIHDIVRARFADAEARRCNDPSVLQHGDSDAGDLVVSHAFLQ